MLDNSLILAIIILFIAVLYFLHDGIFTLIMIISITMALPGIIVMIYSGSVVYTIITESIIIAAVGYWIRDRY